MRTPETLRSYLNTAAFGSAVFVVSSGGYLGARRLYDASQSGLATLREIPLDHLTAGASLALLIALVNYLVIHSMPTWRKELRLALQMQLEAELKARALQNNLEEVLRQLEVAKRASSEEPPPRHGYGWAADDDAEEAIRKAGGFAKKG